MSPFCCWTVILQPCDAVFVLHSGKLASSEDVDPVVVSSLADLVKRKGVVNQTVHLLPLRSDGGTRGKEICS